VGRPAGPAPAGTWQLRAARVYRILVAILLILFLMVFLPHRNLATWALLWILMACAALQTAFYSWLGFEAHSWNDASASSVYDMGAKAVGVLACKVDPITLIDTSERPVSGSERMFSESHLGA